MSVPPRTLHVAPLLPAIAAQAAAADRSRSVDAAVLAAIKGNAHPDRVTEQYGRHLLGLPTENPF